MIHGAIAQRMLHAELVVRAPPLRATEKLAGADMDMDIGVTQNRTVGLGAGKRRAREVARGLRVSRTARGRFDRKGLGVFIGGGHSD